MEKKNLPKKSRDDTCDHMRSNNLRSVTALCRYLSTRSRRRNSDPSRIVFASNETMRSYTRLSGLVLGAGLGYLVHGDSANKLERRRQEHMRKFFWGFPPDTGDLTKKMWPELKELRKKIKSYLREMLPPPDMEP